VQEGGNSYLPAYDALGNVHAMIKASDGSIAAAYEYDAFGQPLRESGPYAAANPFRFATKYTDIETGLVYFDTRYYAPTLGKFINRDTIAEQGGLNLYAYVSNRVPNSFDRLGMDEFDPINTVEGLPFRPRTPLYSSGTQMTQQFFQANVVHYGFFDAQLPGGARGSGLMGTPAPPSSASKHSQNAPERNRSSNPWIEVGSQGEEQRTFTLYDSKGGNVIANGYKDETGMWVISTATPPAAPGYSTRTVVSNTVAIGAGVGTAIFGGLVIGTGPPGWVIGGAAMLMGVTSAGSSIINAVEMATGDGSEPLVPTSGIFGYVAGLRQEATGIYDPSAVETAQWLDLGTGLVIGGIPFTSRQPFTGALGALVDDAQQSAAAAVSIGNSNRAYQAYVRAQQAEEFRYFGSAVWNSAASYTIFDTSAQNLEIRFRPPASIRPPSVRTNIPSDPPPPIRFEPPPRG
jgi:RHS repeat-associated protein